LGSSQLTHYSQISSIGEKLFAVTMSSIVERKKLIKGKVVLVQKSVAQIINTPQGFLTVGAKIVNNIPTLDIVKSVSFKLISSTESENR